MEKVTATRAQARRRRLSAIISSIALGAGDTTVLRLVNAYAILANQGRAREADADRLCPGPQRQGHLPHRQPLRGDGRLQRARLGRQGRCRGRRAATRQLLDPMAAFQMVHIMEGVVQRGTATVLRDLDRPLFGKTGTTTARPTSGSSAARRTSSPASTSATTSRGRMGGYAQGGRIAAPIFKQFAQTALKDHAEGAVRRAAGHPLGAHRPRQRQARCSAPSRPSEDPQVGGDLGGVPAGDRAAPHASRRSAIRTLPRRSSRRRQAQQRSGAAATAAAARRRFTARPPSHRAPVATGAGRAAQPTGLPTQNGVH